MKSFKWDFNEHKYFDYELPEGCTLITPNIKDIVCCAECGHKLEYGDTYTSLKIHNMYGFGYPVCSKCYNNEMKEKLNA